MTVTKFCESTARTGATQTGGQIVILPPSVRPSGQPEQLLSEGIFMSDAMDILIVMSLA